MKGLACALAGFLVFVIASTLFLRARAWSKHFRALVAAFPAGLSAYIALFIVVPASLPVFPRCLREPSSPIDFLNGALVYILLFHLFWDFVYAAAITGFSAGMMLKIERAAPRGISAGELVDCYRGPDGEDAVTSPRMRNLVGGNYLRRQGGTLTLTRKGRLVARAARFFARALSVGMGG